VTIYLSKIFIPTVIPVKAGSSSISSFAGL